ncbi:MAG: alpha-mannosidase [Pleomorphochaeta sp.]
MRYLSDRVQVICDNLKNLSIKQKYDLDKWQYKEGNFLTYKNADLDESQWLDFDAKTMHWYGKDKHYWFSKTFIIPKEFDNKNIWMKVCTQIDEWDDGKNPQFLLFINDVPIQGVDMNHRDILVFENAKAGDVIKLDLQSYTGILHTEFNFITYLYEKDPLLNKLYWDLFVPLNGLIKMDESSLDRAKLLNELNNTINLIDFREPYSKAFYNSIKKASDYINKAVYENLVGYKDIIATCIGHTHIDVAWWWTVEQTKEKVCRSFATVLKLMDEFPSYKFMSSQPLLYAFIKERYPELYTKIKARVKEGRWEVEGGMWVEADCNIPSGESFVRQFVYGMDFFEKEFNKENKLLWLPDVFGYSAALPQILKKVGIDYFMTTKLNWNQWNKFPHDTFNWIGIDGSSVLTHLITTQDAYQDEKSFFTTYNGLLKSDVLIKSWQRYQDKDINNDILIAYGYGDGGGGPTRDMLETSERLEKGVIGIPKVRQEFSRKYFDDLNAKVINNKRLAKWQGELYFEYHRGTYTSMARNKRSNRKTEYGLMDAEFLSVISEKLVEYPKSELDKIWLLTLRNQFHDILPGSSIHEVYEVTKKEYKEIEEELNALIKERINKLCTKEAGLTLFNTTGFSRDEIIEIPLNSANYLIDEDLNKYPIQKNNDKALVEIKNLPSKGFKSYSYGLDENNEIKNDIIIDDCSFENPLLKVTFDETGCIVSIFDKEANREVVNKGEKANLFRMFEDKPIYYDNWNTDIYYTEKYWDVLNLEKFEWIEKGPLRATLLIERKISKSFIRQEIHFYYNSKKIDFETFVDYHEAQHLLKVFFPTNIHSDEATFDIQFGNLKRKTHSNTSWDEARFESCAHKWADVSEGHYGFSLLNDCKYGYSADNGTLALTLIKTGIEPNPVADQEEHYFTYSILPHLDTWIEGESYKQAAFLNQKVLTVSNKSNISQFSFASIDKENVIIDTIKKTEDGTGIIIRLFENENSLTRAKLKVSSEFTKVYSCNLRELENNLLTVQNGMIDIEIKPYEILTIKLL